MSRKRLPDMWRKRFLTSCSVNFEALWPCASYLSLLESYAVMVDMSEAKEPFLSLSLQIIALTKTGRHAPYMIVTTISILWVWDQCQATQPRHAQFVLLPSTSCKKILGGERPETKHQSFCCSVRLRNGKELGFWTGIRGNNSMLGIRFSYGVTWHRWLWCLFLYIVLVVALCVIHGCIVKRDYFFLCFFFLT